MIRNGMHALDFHGPALVGGALTYLRGTRYIDQVVALCFLPYAGIVSADMIDRHARNFHDIDAALLIVASGTRPLHRLWGDQQANPLTPILADLCGRFHRAFGVAVVELAQRCHTFVIDRTGLLRLRVSHDFVEHDLSVLREVIGSSQSRMTEAPASEVEGITAGIAYLPV